MGSRERRLGVEESVLSLYYACSYLILLDSLPKAKCCCPNVYFGQRVHDEEQPALNRVAGGQLVCRMIMRNCCWFGSKVLQQLEGLVESGAGGGGGGGPK